MTLAGERFTLQLPADPGYVGTARMFASSLARHFEIDEAVIADLTLAVSEACSRALVSQEAGRPLALTAATEDGRLVFEVAQGAVVPPPPEETTPTPSHEALAATMSLELIGALFQDAEIATGASGEPVLRFSVP